jgi:predicted GIY-YIG superfamily endonuclease
MEAKLPKHSDSKSEEMLNHLNHRLLNYNISQVRKQRHFARVLTHKLEQKLYNTLNQDDINTIINILDTSIRATHFQETKQKRNKLNMLTLAANEKHLQKHNTALKNAPKDNVINLSDQTLTEAQISILAKGPKFAITDQRMPVIELIKGIETLPHTQERELTMTKLHRFVTKKLKQQDNITQLERKALGELRKNDNIIILTADKGGSIVVMNKDDYDRKMGEIVNNTQNYSVKHTEYPKKVKNKLTKLCTDLTNNKKDALNAEVKDNKITNTAKDNLIKEYKKEIKLVKSDDTNKTPHIYGAPKIHKENVPLRPIVSTIDSSMRNLETHLKHILTPLSNNSIYNVKNPKQVLEKLNSINIDENTRCCSFDVVNMFNNIPRQKLLTILKTELEKDITLIERTSFTPTDICKLVDFALTHTHFQYQNQIFVQNSGLAMGSKISPILADICMENILNEAMESFTEKPILYVKYVDDCLCVYDNTKIDSKLLLTHLNTIDNNVKFTLEEEKDTKLPFLDILITREHNKFITKVYRKPTDKGAKLNYNSNHSYATKATVVRADLIRAYEYCTENSDLEKELSTVYQNLFKNNYTKSFINRVHRKVKFHISNRNNNNHTQQTQNPTNTTNTLKTTATIVLPYVHQIAGGIQKTVKELMPTVRVAFTSKNTIRKIVSKVKPITKPLQNNCVYEIKCKSCDGVYYGQTKRDLATRIKEHKRALTKPQDENNKNHNRLALHAQKHLHEPDFDGARVVHKENNLRRRLVAEAMLIITTQTNDTNGAIIEIFSQSSITVNKMWLQAIRDYFDQLKQTTKNATKQLDAPPAASRGAKTAAREQRKQMRRKSHADTDERHPPTHTYALRPPKRNITYRQ